MQAASSCRPQLEGTGLVQVSCIDVVSRHLTRLGLLLASSCTAAGGPGAGAADELSLGPARHPLLQCKSCLLAELGADLHLMPLPNWLECGKEGPIQLKPVVIGDSSQLAAFHPAIGVPAPSFPCWRRACKCWERF